ncbi:hypothetical protein C2869_14980 [Saccharobesus litoralis]|uniref:PTS system glucose-specific EIIA component n=1 Tax=Saccharobesus litoralis TaxID=2172099 RepID=A0A2S0VU91_9ALTE|nr:PTS glucose transporter subunit IIA [Saccharobesus litoralis]AWB67660.1 hypothetical protein C2869_14980 [Saccharobesus litoralis]
MAKADIIHPFGKKQLQGSYAIPAPCNASIKPLSEYPRPLVADGYFGQGIMFEPFGYKFVSPLTGVLDHMPATCHRIKLTSKQGLKIDIRFGLETESLMATGFKCFVKTGDVVQQGDLLFEFDLARMKRELASLASYLTITNSHLLESIMPYYHEVRAQEDPIMSIKPRRKT